MFKADAALDAASASAAKSEKEAASVSSTSAASAPSAAQPKLATTGTAGTTIKRSAERDKVQSKLDFATALSHLGQGNYEKAAIAFLRLGSADGLGDWMGSVRHVILSRRADANDR